MTKTLKLIFSTGALLSAGFFLPATAHAKKPGVLEGKPIVVEKLELRKFRFQITPQVGMTFGQPFRHKGFAGAALRFDLTDWVGVRASFNYGVFGVDSKLLKDLNGGGLPAGTQDMAGNFIRPQVENDNPAPLRNDFRAGLTEVSYLGSLDLAFTPFAGKLGLFSGIFTEYDFYIFGGFGYAGYKRTYPDEQSTSDILGIGNQYNPAGDQWCQRPNMGAQSSECALHPVKADEGFRAGGSIGGGLHLFLADWIAINPEVQDIIVQHNDAGLNATILDVPPQVNNGGSNRDFNDRTVRNNVMFNLGVTFYLLPKAKRSKLDRGRTAAPAAAATAPVEAPSPDEAPAEEASPPSPAAPAPAGAEEPVLE